LVLLTITSLVTGIGSVLFFDEISQLVTNFTKGLLYLQLFSILIEFVSIYYIFKWKKLGFYGVIAAYFLNIYINDKAGILDINTILGIAIRIGLLYGILRIKSKGVSGWDHLTE
jgi:hypothetical protein